MRVNAPIFGEKGQNSAPCQSKKRQERPDHTVDAPPVIWWGERPEAELASHLGVGDKAVSEAGKGRFT